MNMQAIEKRLRARILTFAFTRCVSTRHSLESGAVLWIVCKCETRLRLCNNQMMQVDDFQYWRNQRQRPIQWREYTQPVEQTWRRPRTEMEMAVYALSTVFTFQRLNIHCNSVYSVFHMFTIKLLEERFVSEWWKYQNGWLSIECINTRRLQWGSEKQAERVRMKLILDSWIIWLFVQWSCNFIAFLSTYRKCSYLSWAHLSDTLALCALSLSISPFSCFFTSNSFNE